MTGLLLVLSVFLAAFVEGIEALTIVLAIGTTRGWRSTLYGMATALATLSLLVATLGPTLASIPINALRLFIGGLLLIFGMQWLRKAILRASGLVKLHNEDDVYKKTITESAAAKQQNKKILVDDWYAYTIAFKGVLLEGLEIVFIVITFGTTQGSVTLATIGAIAAIAVVVSAGLLIHKPLSKVPENTLKFIVGIMLCGFGIFWGSEGAGIHWPGNDISLLLILGFIGLTSLMQVRLLKFREEQKVKHAIS